MSKDIEHYSVEDMSPEERLRMGLIVDTPAPPSFEQVAKAVGEDPEELALMRGVRNRDDYEEAKAKIAALRELRDEQRRSDLRDDVLGL